MNILDKNKVRIDFTFQNLKKKKKKEYLIVSLKTTYCPQGERGLI